MVKIWLDQLTKWQKKGWKSDLIRPSWCYCLSAWRHFPLSIGKNRVFFNFHTCWPPENFHSSYYLMLGSWQVEMFNRFYRETMRSMDWWFMGAARTLGDTLVVGYALRFTTWCNIWLTVFLFAGWNKRFQWDPNGGMTPAKETMPPDPNPKKNGCPTWGLTGSIGMGKSTVSKWLQAKRAKKFALSLPCLFPSRMVFSV